MCSLISAVLKTMVSLSFSYVFSQSITREPSLIEMMNQELNLSGRDEISIFNELYDGKGGSGRSLAVILDRRSESQFKKAYESTRDYVLTKASPAECVMVAADLRDRYLQGHDGYYRTELRRLAEARRGDRNLVLEFLWADAESQFPLISELERWIKSEKEHGTGTSVLQSSLRHIAEAHDRNLALIHDRSRAAINWPMDGIEAVVMAQMWNRGLGTTAYDSVSSRLAELGVRFTKTIHNGRDVFLEISHKDETVGLTDRALSDMLRILMNRGNQDGAVTRILGLTRRLYFGSEPSARQGLDSSERVLLATYFYEQALGHRSLEALKNLVDLYRHSFGHDGLEFAGFVPTALLIADAAHRVLGRDGERFEFRRHVVDAILDDRHECEARFLD
jgi:hypothetical protein